MWILNAIIRYAELVSEDIFAPRSKNIVFQSCVPFAWRKRITINLEVCTYSVAPIINSPSLAISGLLVQQIGIDERQYAIWEEMELSQLSVLLHCRKWVSRLCYLQHAQPCHFRCQRSVPVVRQEHDESRLLVCPLPDCNHIWCKACQQSVAIGGPSHSCDGTSELDHLMKQRGWKYCPSIHSSYWLFAATYVRWQTAKHRFRGTGDAATWPCVISLLTNTLF